MNTTLTNGLVILESLARTRQGAGVTELAAQTGIGKSNVHRLLQSLVETGYVRRAPGGADYMLTLKLWQLGFGMFADLDPRDFARPTMEKLGRQCSETVHLSVLDGDDVVYLDKIDSPQPIRAYSDIGGRAPAHCVATGKAMLAGQGDSFLREFSARLSQKTPLTITDPVGFMAEMALIRKQGWALNRGEWRDSVRGVAAPICDPAGRIIAAIGISGPRDRLPDDSIAEHAAQVVAAAAEVCRAIAGEAPDTATHGGANSP